MNAQLTILKTATRGLAKKLKEIGAKRLIIILKPEESGFENIIFKAEMQTGEIKDITEKLKKL
jgi:hypothetical protein